MTVFKNGIISFRILASIYRDLVGSKSNPFDSLFILCNTYFEDYFQKKRIYKTAILTALICTVFILGGVDRSRESSAPVVAGCWPASVQVVHHAVPPGSGPGPEGAGL